ncbi:MAG TPA: hypothetical protein VGF94_19170 [Kofleriaceae bacterium]|jgi:hypothetical protein
MARRRRDGKDSGSKPWTLRADASPICVQAAEIVGAELLWHALTVFGRSDAEEHPRLSLEEKRLRAGIRRTAKLLRARVAKLAGDSSRTARDASTLLATTADRLGELTKTESGHARALVTSWCAVIHKLRVGNDRYAFTYGQIADVVLRSNDGWKRVPCPKLVKKYTGVIYGSDGRDRLIERIKALYLRTRHRVVVRS